MRSCREQDYSSMEWRAWGEATFLILDSDRRIGAKEDKDSNISDSNPELL